MFFLFGMKDRSNLNGFRRAGVPQFDVKRPISKIFLNDRALISKISLFIFTNIVLVEYAGMHRARRFIIIHNTVHNWHDFKDLIFVWRYLYLEIDIFAKSYIVHLCRTLMNWLNNQRKSSTVLALYHHHYRTLGQFVSLLMKGSRNFIGITCQLLLTGLMPEDKSTETSAYLIDVKSNFLYTCIGCCKFVYF